jgi:hypothetical protein
MERIKIVGLARLSEPFLVEARNAHILAYFDCEIGGLLLVAVHWLKPRAAAPSSSARS